MPDFTKYSATPGNNTNAPPNGAPEGWAPSSVNDTLRDTMAVIRDLGDRARGPIALLGSVAGTNTITASASPELTAYAAGQRFILPVANAVTGAATLNVDSVGAVGIKKGDGTADLASGDIPAGSVAEVVYLTAPAAHFRLLSVSPGAGLTASVPVGTVTDFAGATAPAGWLLCYGQAISRSTYAALFSAIGTTWGVGNGSTTFNVPDLRGRVTAGKDNMGGTAANRLTNSGTGNSGINGSTLGAAGGVDRHQLTIAQMPAHTHSVLYGSGSGAGLNNDDGAQVRNTSSTGGDEAHPNVQPTAVVNKIIFAGVA